MAVLRRLRKMIFPLELRCSKLQERGFSAAAAMAMPDVDDYWELPLPVLRNIHGQRAARGPQMIFLGSPGADKAAYASRLAKLLNVPHISMGHLLRKEASLPSPYYKQLADLLMHGELVPDDVIFRVLSKRLEQKIEFEESGFIFDGFPRTINQAEILDEVADIDLVVNLKLRRDYKVKVVDQRVCAKCGHSMDDTNTELEGCAMCKALSPSGASKLLSTDQLRDRLRTHSTHCKPVEYHYRKQRKLLDFEVSGGISQAWPRLLSALRLEDSEAILIPV